MQFSIGRVPITPLLVSVMNKCLLILLLILKFLPQEIYPHGGGLASDGCHFDHKKGTRHCHRGQDGKVTDEVDISGAKVYVYNPDFLGNMIFKDFSSAKKELWKIYEKNPETFYCGCEISDKQPVHSNCGYMDSSPLSYAIEWEHIVPLSHLAMNTPAYFRGHEKCVLENGKKYMGRICASKYDEHFQRMESDLYNLVPVIAAVNRKRSNNRFAEIEGEETKFPGCDFEVDEVDVMRKKKKAVEPRDEVKGFIGRVHLYMMRTYRSEYQIWGEERVLMEKWNKMYPPYEWECERGQLIELIQGNRNPVLYSRCSEVEMSW